MAEKLPEAVSESIRRIIDERDRRLPQPININLIVDGSVLANAVVTSLEDQGKAV